MPDKNNTNLALHKVADAFPIGEGGGVADGRGQKA